MGKEGPRGTHKAVGAPGGSSQETAIRCPNTSTSGRGRTPEATDSLFKDTWEGFPCRSSTHTTRNTSCHPAFRETEVKPYLGTMGRAVLGICPSSLR